MNILIVEDDLISGELLKKLLAPYGKCHIVESGDQAVLEFKQSLYENNFYDLICLDIMIPNINGIKVLKLIRKLEENLEIKNSVKIIMTTALSNFDIIKDSYKAQCQDYLIKPIIRSKIQSSLERLSLI